MEKTTEKFRLDLQRWPLLSHLGNTKESILGRGNSMNKGMKQDISGSALEITSIQFVGL